MAFVFFCTLSMDLDWWWCIDFKCFDNLLVYQYLLYNYLRWQTRGGDYFEWSFFRLFNQLLNKLLIICVKIRLLQVTNKIKKGFIVCKNVSHSIIIALSVCVCCGLIRCHTTLISRFTLSSHYVMFERARFLGCACAWAQMSR